MPHAIHRNVILSWVVRFKTDFVNFTAGRAFREDTEKFKIYIFLNPTFPKATRDKEQLNDMGLLVFLLLRI